MLVWEGAKAFGAANGYALNLGGTTIDLTILNDSQLPHLADIARAFAEPAQRNGDPLYVMLLQNGLYTFGAALRGFLLGGVIGFALAIVFAHSSLLQRGLLPYVVASQTVPILAVAPMVVIWMSRAGAVEWSVPMIAAYLTFFPVTIYTLRGLTSVPETRLRTDADLRRQQMGNPDQAAPAQRAAANLHRPENLGDGERRRRDHRRAAVGHPERLGHRHFELRPLLQPVAAAPVGDDRGVGLARHPVLRGRWR